MPSAETSPDLPAALAEFVARSPVALTLADLRRPDCPLVAVNGRFCDMSGYAADEVLGRNCRFLQPPGGAGPVRDRMRAFIHSDAEPDGRFMIANERRDGAPFLNLVYMAKLEVGGRARWILGSQFDLTRHRVPQAEYDAALEADLRSLASLMEAERGVLLGSFASLATSHRLIAQARVEG